ncbi:hypothetical protein A7A08_02147 [Methyloligella halotolerans]|uniref:Uncharacterized protein n=1 Tax=Methyloligella halotolerans TaxID=1177755 RepID=A0A1E2RXI7_9HYPH|nr:hypothetical protein A7A08_02147 [Methyloligella halotolerans]
MTDESDNDVSDKEVSRRRDAALKRALNTPPKPRKSEDKENSAKKPPTK